MMALWSVKVLHKRLIKLSLGAATQANAILGSEYNIRVRPLHFAIYVNPVCFLYKQAYYPYARNEYLNFNFMDFPPEKNVNPHICVQHVLSSRAPKPLKTRIATRNQRIQNIARSKFV